MTLDWMHTKPTESLPESTKLLLELQKRCEDDIKALLTSKPKPIILYLSPPPPKAEGEVIIAVIYESKRKYFWALTIERARTLANDYLISQGYTGEL